jgi:uncharacterized protein (TIGR03083 family)
MTATAGTSAAPDYQQIVDAVGAEFRTLDQFLVALAPARWQGPTACTEWNLTKLVSHLTSGAIMHLSTVKVGTERAEPLTQEGRQQIWSRMDSLSADQLYPEFQRANREYQEYMEGLTPEQRGMRVQSFAGEVPMAVLTRFRLNELSLHSWDARVALDPTARLLFGSVGPLVEQALNTVARRSSADERARLKGTVFEIDLEGRHRRRIGLAVGEDAVAVEQPGGGTPKAALWLPAEAFVRLAAGRFPLEAAERNGEVAIDGDRTTALRLNALFPGF